MPNPPQPRSARRRARLPTSAGQTRVVVKAGAASVDLYVPYGVAARIRNQSGLSGNNFDTARFPRTSGDTYESPDFASATNRADISIESGIGSVNVR